MQSSILLIFEIGLIIVFASILSEFAKRLHIPSLIGAMALGLFLGGPGGIGLVINTEFMDILASLGAVILLFITGLNFDAKFFLKSGKNALLLTGCGFLLSLIIGVGVGLFLGWGFEYSFLLGVLISPSGTSVIASILEQRGHPSKSEGLLLTSAILDDIFTVILFSIALNLLENKATNPEGVLLVTLSSIVFVIGAIISGNEILPRVLPKIEGKVSEDFLFMLLLGFGLILAFVASTYFGLAAMTGAFIMGAVIPVDPYGRSLAKKLSLMKDTFLSIFFVSFGISIDPANIPILIPVSMLILTAALVGRIGGGILGGLIVGVRGREILFFATGLAIKGEMSLIIAKEAIDRGVDCVSCGSISAIAFILITGSILLLGPLLGRFGSKTDSIVMVEFEKQNSTADTT